MEMEELISAIKEAVDERIEQEQESVAEAVKDALEPVLTRLEKVEEALGLVNKELGASKAIIGQDLNDNGGVATQSATRRDAWGRKVRS